MNNLDGTARRTAKNMDAGLGGAMRIALSAIEGTALAIGDALAPSLISLIRTIEGVATGLTTFVKANQEMIVQAAKGVAIFTAVGGALIGVGVSLQASSFAMGALGKSVALAVSPLSVLGRVFAVASAQAVGLATSVGAAMLSASSSALSFAASAGTSLAAMATASSAGMATLAASTAAGFARMAASAAAASQTMFPVFFTGFNRGISAGAGFFAATARGLNGVVMASGVLRTALLAVSGSGMARFVTDIGSGLALTYKSFVWWATGATARMAQYIVNMTGAVGATIASTAAMATAWMGTAARGVLEFVGASMAGLASYLGAAAMAVAGSVASAAAVAAAWLAPLAPFALLAAALGGAVALAYSFGGSIKSAFSGLGELVGQAGTAIGGMFGGAIAEATTVFGDLATTAITTFSGIYAAIAEGDLAGAMDVLWAGLYAGWLRGV
ncbi:MAG: phage tail tape measure protein, partial [Proteobacteria bacterium]|nr:phage tail tape measure protein [Pseudomonadota bacterium]